MVKITYIVMLYNEVSTIKQAIKDVLSIKYPNKEIIVIDNCSNDGSKEIVDSFDGIKKIYKDKNYGAGKTVETGIQEAKGEYIYFQFADLEYDYLRSLDMLQYAIENKLDIVLGSRLKGKKIFEELRKKPSYLATITTTYILNKFYNKNFTDIIGAKLYKTASVKKIPVNSYGSGFDWEFLSRACKRKLKIGEISINYKPRLIQKNKKIKFYNIFNAFFELLKVKIFE